MNENSQRSHGYASGVPQMRGHRRIGLIAMAVAFLLSACGGDVEDTSDVPNEDQQAAAEPSTTSSSVAPTAPSVVIDDDARIEAALAAFRSEEAGNYQAVDILSSTVQDEAVELTVCAWHGDDVYDEVLALQYDTAAGESGDVVAQLIGSETPNQTCLNSELVSSAFAFIDEHDRYWTTVLEDPTTFDPESRAPEIFTPGNLALSTDLVAGWVADGVHWQGQSLLGEVEQTSAFEPVWRRYEGPNAPIFGVAVCRAMQDGYGLYRGDVLVDDRTQGLDVLGEHAIAEYILVRQDGAWRVEGLVTLVWANCLGAGTWLEGANSWKPEPVLWQEFS